MLLFSKSPSKVSYVSSPPNKNFPGHNMERVSNRDISRPWKTYLFEVVLLQRVPNQQEYKSHNTSNMLLQSNTTHLYMCIYNATASHPCTYLVYLILGKHTGDTEHKLKEYLNLKT